MVGQYGHLSNDAVWEFLSHDAPRELQNLILGHISRDNNLSGIVEASARDGLARRGLNPRLSHRYSTCSVVPLAW